MVRDTRILLVLCTLFPVACDSAKSNTSTTGEDVVIGGGVAPDGAVGPHGPAETCDTAAWSPGTTVFKEVTTDWGLDGISGAAFSVADYDGDGWPDLFIRAGSGEKDYAPGTWLLRNTGNKSFEDVTESSGILSTRQEGGDNPWRGAYVAVWGDVNNDGHLDVFTANGTPPGWAGETPEMMLSNGDGTFSLGPEAGMARRAGLLNSPNGASFTDFDRDGNLDLFVVHHDQVDENGYPHPVADHLYQGDGQGLTTDVSNQVGLITQPWGVLSQLNGGEGHSWAWSAVACDLNNDGTSELLAASYGRAPNTLWQGVRQGDGSVTYVNRSVASGYGYDHREDWTDNWSARCHCQDFPDDDECGLTEPIDPGVCQGLKNSFGGQYRWSHPGDREPWRLGGNSGTTLCMDLNNDGHLDLFTNEIVHADVGQSSDPSEVMVNTGEANVRFERPGPEATGIYREHEPGSYWDHGDMTSTMLDFDNDGWMDLYLGASEYPGNRGLLYHQSSPLAFTEVSITDAFEHNRSDGAVAVDFDRDGDEDLLVGHSHMRCEPTMPNDCYPTRQIRLFENLVGQDGSWLQLELQGGSGTNRSAIGARVEITAHGITRTREVGGGYGKGGFQNGLVVHAGLDDACTADVRILWPDAQRSEQTFTVDANRRYNVVQGEAPVPSPDP